MRCHSKPKTELLLTNPQTRNRLVLLAFSANSLRFQQQKIALQKRLRKMLRTRIHSTAVWPTRIFSRIYLNKNMQLSEAEAVAAFLGKRRLEEAERITLPRANSHRRCTWRQNHSAAMNPGSGLILSWSAPEGASVCLKIMFPLS